MAQDFSELGRTLILAIDAGLSDSPCCSGPLRGPLQHTNPTSHQSVALKFLMHGVRPQDGGVLIVGHCSLEWVIG